MASLNNCTINSSTVTVTKGVAFGSTASQELIITPDDGYVIAASNFTNHTGALTGINNYTGSALGDGLTYVNGIALSDTGTAYASGNTVKVTCDLDNSYTPNSNTTFTIDIGGSATDPKLVPYTWDGKRTITGSNKTPANVTNEDITQATGISGELKEIESVVIEASSGYHFATAPTCTLSGLGSYTSNYQKFLEPVPPQDSNGNWTKYKGWVNYEFPAANVSGAVITWNAVGTANPGATANTITNYSADETNISSNGEERSIKIFGSLSTSKFELVITRVSDSYTYNFTTDTFASGSNSFNASGTAVGSSLSYVVNGIKIPVDDGGETYNIKITAVSPTTAASTLNNYNNSSPTFTWTQVAKRTLTITANSAAKTLTKTYVDNTIDFATNLEEEEDPLYTLANFQIKAVNPSGGALQIRRDAVFSDSVAYDTAGNNDFSNTLSGSNGGTTFSIGKLETAGDNTSTITLTGILNIFETGNADVSSVIQLDNIINQAPTSNALAINVDYETAKTFNLSASDPEGDTLTYSTVGSPSNGSLSGLNTSTGAITYTPNSSFSGTDTFTYKVNDTHEDSNTATVTLTVAGSGGSSVARYEIEIYNSGGYLTGVHYIDATQVCESGSLTSSVCLSWGSLTNKWFRYVTAAGGCGSTVYGRAKLKGAVSAGTPTAYINENEYFDTMADSQNNTNATSC